MPEKKTGSSYPVALNAAPRSQIPPTKRRNETINAAMFTQLSYRMTGAADAASTPRVGDKLRFSVSPIMGVAVPEAVPTAGQAPQPQTPAAGTLRIIMTSEPELPPFGWYPDPAGTNMLRWWNGTSWTNNLERRRAEVQSAQTFSTQGFSTQGFSSQIAS